MIATSCIFLDVVQCWENSNDWHLAIPIFLNVSLYFCNLFFFQFAVFDWWIKSMVSILKTPVYDLGIRNPYPWHLEVRGPLGSRYRRSCHWHRGGTSSLNSWATDWRKSPRTRSNSSYILYKNKTKKRHFNRSCFLWIDLNKLHISIQIERFIIRISYGLIKIIYHFEN